MCSPARRPSLGLALAIFLLASALGGHASAEDAPG